LNSLKRVRLSQQIRLRKIIISVDDELYLWPKRINRSIGNEE
jgi:hypothetical protein